MLRRTENDGTRKVFGVVVPGKVGKGRPKLSWQVEVEQGRAEERRLQR